MSVEGWKVAVVTGPCEQCRFWNRFPSQAWGLCRYTDEPNAIMDANGPLTTRKEFACVKFEAKEQQ